MLKIFLMTVLVAFLAAACGPKTIVDSETPQTKQPEGEGEEGVIGEAASGEAGEPAGSGLGAGDEGEDEGGGEPEGEEEEGGAGAAGAKPLIGETTSASETDVKPMVKKDFDFQADMDFSPSLVAGKKKDTMEKIQKALADILECYKKLLPENPNLQGEMNVIITILPEGKVKSVKFESDTTGSEKLQDCTKKSFKKLKFEKKIAGGKSVQATVPITIVQQ
jgi:hypothetical protein